MKERFSLLRSISNFLSKITALEVMIVIVLTGMVSAMIFSVRQKSKEEVTKNEAARIEKAAGIVARNQKNIVKTGLSGPRIALWNSMQSQIFTNLYTRTNGLELLTLTDKTGIGLVPSLEEGESGYLAVDKKSGYLGVNLLYSADQGGAAAIALLEEFNRRIVEETNYYGLYSLRAGTNKTISFSPFGTNLLATNYLPSFSEPPAPVTNVVTLPPQTNSLPAPATTTTVTNAPSALSSAEARTWAQQKKNLVSALNETENGPALIKMANQRRLALVPLSPHSVTPQHLVADQSGGQIALRVSSNTHVGVSAAQALLESFKSRRHAPGFYTLTGQAVHYAPLAPGETAAHHFQAQESRTNAVISPSAPEALTATAQTNAPPPAAAVLSPQKPAHDTPGKHESRHWSGHLAEVRRKLGEKNLAGLLRMADDARIGFVPLGHSNTNAPFLYVTPTNGTLGVKMSDTAHTQSLSTVFLLEAFQQQTNRAGLYRLQPDLSVSFEPASPAPR